MVGSCRVFVCTISLMSSAACGEAPTSRLLPPGSPTPENSSPSSLGFVDWRVELAILINPEGGFDGNPEGFGLVSTSGPGRCEAIIEGADIEARTDCASCLFAVAFAPRELRYEAPPGCPSPGTFRSALVGRTFYFGHGLSGRLYQNDRPAGDGEGVWGELEGASSSFSEVDVDPLSNLARWSFGAVEDRLDD